MRKKRFAMEQIVAALKESEAVPALADGIRPAQITEQALYRWKAAYAGLDYEQAKQLKQLQAEIEQLKKIVAALDPTTLDGAFKKR